MPFQYQPYHSDLTGTIADLMGAPARTQAAAMTAAAAARANALQQNGQNTAHAFGTLGQIGMGAVQDIQQQQEQAPRREMEQLALEQARRQNTTAQRENAEEAWLRSRLADTEKPQPTLDELKAHLGPQRALAIYQGFQQVTASDLQNEDKAIDHLGRDLKFVMALPGNMKQDMWGALKSRWAGFGVPSELIPDQYDDASAAALLKRTQKPQQPFTLGPGQKRFDENGQEIASAPERPMSVAPGASLVDPSNPSTPVYTAPAKETKPPAAQEYEYAKSQGYKGTFEQYQNEDANRRRSVTNVNTGPQQGALDQDGLEYAATQYRLTGQMPALGMGKNADRGKIINEAAKQTKLLNQTPAAAIQRQAARKADTASLTKIQTIKDGAEASESKALAQLDLIRDLSSKVSRTNWPIINKALVGGQKEITGDSNTTQLYNAILTFGQEYGKIIEGSTGSVAGSSEGARNAASRLVNAAMSKGTLSDVLTLMQKEMRYTLQGYDATLEHINERLGSGPVPAATDTAVPVARPNTGTVKMQAPNGQTRDVPAAEVEHYKSLGAKVVGG
jgi:hypothetical protein